MKKIEFDKSVENEIVEMYKNGITIYKLNKKFNINSKIIKRILIENNVEIKKTFYNTSDLRTPKVNIKELISFYNECNNLTKTSKEFNISSETIKRYLNKNEIKTESKFSKKIQFTESEKKEIIRMYVEEKRGAKYIGKIFNRSDNSINNYLKKWGIPKNTRSEISLKIREIYGATKGFSGHNHTEKSKNKISKSVIKDKEENDREISIGKSRQYNTIIGKVLGSHEVAYLQMLLNENKELPKVCKKRIKTEFGYYLPDFEFLENYIEVKSEFTLKVCKGEMVDGKGEKNNKQWNKIMWTNENIKKVDIVVVKRSEYLKLFQQAIDSGLLLDKVKIKYNRIFKIE